MDEMRRNFHAQRSKEFAAHDCNSTLRVKRRRLPRSHPMHSQGKTASAMAGCFCASFFLRASHHFPRHCEEFLHCWRKIAIYTHDESSFAMCRRRGAVLQERVLKIEVRDLWLFWVVRGGIGLTGDWVLIPAPGTPNECLHTLPRTRASPEPIGHYRGMKPGRPPELRATRCDFRYTLSLPVNSHSIVFPVLSASRRSTSAPISLRPCSYLESCPWLTQISRANCAW